MLKNKLSRKLGYYIAKELSIVFARTVYYKMYYCIRFGFVETTTSLKLRMAHYPSLKCELQLNNHI